MSITINKSTLSVRNKTTGTFEPIDVFGSGGTSQEVDKTLSKDGVAADAKITGENFTKINDKLNGMYDIRCVSKLPEDAETATNTLFFIIGDET